MNEAPGNIPKSPRICAGILAGGRARRMGGEDKGLLSLAGKRLIEHIIEALAPQVDEVIINANRNRPEYGIYRYAVIPDAIDGFCGPLAGTASIMQATTAELVVTAPCDSPFLPGDLVSRLDRGLHLARADISVAHNGERMQPVFALMKRDLLPSLLDYLTAGERKIDRWFDMHNTVTVDFADQPDTFLNINTPEDLRIIEKKLGGHGHQY